MRILLLAPVDIGKFAGERRPPPPYDQCPIPFPQPQAFWWKAMRDLGHQVQVYGYAAERWPGLPLPLGLARLATRAIPGIRNWAVPAAMYLRHSPPVLAFNQDLLATIERTSPEVLLISGGIVALQAATVAQIRRLGVRTIMLRGIPFATHPARNEIEMAEYLDLAVVNDPHHELDWRLCGCMRTLCLPISACDPDFHRPLPLEDSSVRNHTANVCFVGSFEPRVYYGSNRLGLLEAVADLGLAIYSSTPAPLRDSPRLMACWRGQARQADMPAIISAAKVSLNVLARAMPGGGNYRTFEIAGCGGFQLCDKFQDAWFTNGREIARFTTPADLRAAVIKYLNQEDQRSAIASAARVRAVREHTFKHRFAILLDALEGLS